MKTVTQIATEMADREAIRECLMRYCRGMDRLDAELSHEVYWPDSTDNHVGFVGTGAEFVKHAMSALGAMEQTAHLLGNILIEMDGSAAANTETYFNAFHRLRGDGKGNAAPSDLLVGGRYVDRMEKREDQWRLKDRVVIIDWFRQFQDSADWANVPLGLDAKPGSRKPVDRSYELLARRKSR